MKIGNVTVTPAVMNAACSVAKTIEDVENLAMTKVGAVLVGSITVKPRKTNPAPNWLTDDSYSINSFGMPNGGAKFYQKNLPKMIEITHKAHKKFVLSIAGFSTDEYVQLAALADDAKVDLLEINLGCPNISVSGAQKTIASFDIQVIKEIIEEISQITNIPLMVKLSPYSNPADLQTVAKVIANSTVSAVVTSNTFPNGSMRAISNYDKLAGISGPALLPIALGQVQQFRGLLPKNIAVIGVGGIESKKDVELYTVSGASAVQAATIIVRDGHKAIDKLIS